jgi:hypothetical protein
MTSVLDKSIIISDLLNHTDKILVQPLDYQRTTYDLGLEITEAIENDLVLDDPEIMEHDLALMFPLCAVSILNETIEENGTVDILFEFTYKQMSIYFQNIEIY